MSQEVQRRDCAYFCKMIIMTALPSRRKAWSSMISLTIWRQTILWTLLSITMRVIPQRWWAWRKRVMLVRIFQKSWLDWMTQTSPERVRWASRASRPTLRWSAGCSSWWTWFSWGISRKRSKRGRRRNAVLLWRGTSQPTTIKWSCLISQQLRNHNLTKRQERSTKNMSPGTQTTYSKII
jgi:hypothetical protein